MYCLFCPVVANEGQRIDIPDGCILENRLLSGNLSMIVSSYICFARQFTDTIFIGFVKMAKCLLSFQTDVFFSRYGYSTTVKKGLSELSIVIL
jgi:hypothetical protein